MTGPEGARWGHHRGKEGVTTQALQVKVESEVFVFVCNCLCLGLFSGILQSPRLGRAEVSWLVAPGFLFYVRAGWGNWPATGQQAGDIHMLFGPELLNLPLSSSLESGESP